MFLGAIVILVSLVVCMLPTRNQAQSDNNLTSSLLLLVIGLFLLFRGLGFSFTVAPLP